MLILYPTHLLDRVWYSLPSIDMSIVLEVRGLDSMACLVLCRYCGLYRLEIYYEWKGARDSKRSCSPALRVQPGARLISHCRPLWLSTPIVVIYFIMLHFIKSELKAPVESMNLWVYDR